MPFIDQGLLVDSDGAPKATAELVDKKSRFRFGPRSAVSEQVWRQMVKLVTKRIFSNGTDEKTRRIIVEIGGKTTPTKRRSIFPWPSVFRKSLEKGDGRGKSRFETI